jgi:hypothetical protein
MGVLVEVILVAKVVFSQRQWCNSAKVTLSEHLSVFGSA